ncbi:CO2 hydration protein [Spirulina sp. CCNP1310]|uniref:CO2 hydration protein n=1 Tax=Spirulina sp. CCNP1310 TaxID=3110249 RepID=UPI002B1FE179|nr:CO2 hydration protein [Spirulina sp. CCNP1310]MEA5419284.1 CO2 hydration protein [Spirulina sp. CCNP1310]
MLTTLQPPIQLNIENLITRLESGEALLRDTPQNLVEVVGILKSYGVVLDAYSNNLIYIADHQFLRLFPFFKYCNGDRSLARLKKHWWHDRINYEYAEYCMKAMFWHGGGKLDQFLDSPEFSQLAEQAIRARWQGNPALLTLHRIFPNYLPEQVRQLCYYSALGQFWRVMSDIFINLSDAYDRGEIANIPAVVAFILAGLVADAGRPIHYTVAIKGQPYDLLPPSQGLTFLMDVAVPYVEAVFFRGTPFPGTVSYNAQAYQIPQGQDQFAYGALYADPLPIGGSGIPPTLLMQDMRHFLPEYLHAIYRQRLRQEDDLRVQICESFQKSMFCVTTAAIQGLAPHPLNTTDPTERAANRLYLKGWLRRLRESRLVRMA